MKMNRRGILTSAAGAISLAAVSAGTRKAAAADSINWRFQTLWQAGTANQLAFERFAKNVAIMTDGQINITALPAEAGVGVTEMLDAVQGGVLNGYHSAVVYWTGRNPAFAALGDLNAGYDSPYQQMDYYYNHGGLELLREAYAPFDLYPIGPVWWGVESIPLTKPAYGPADLAGLKLRMPQGMSSDIFAAFGATPINLPGTEVFSALDNGTIDGTDWGTLSMNAELGFHDKAKYAIYPGIHSMPVGDVVVKKSDWDSLTDSQKRILESAVSDFNLDMLETLDGLSRDYAKKLKEDGVELIDWNKEARSEFRNTARSVWEKYAEKNDLTRRAVESQVDYLKSIGLLS